MKKIPQYEANRIGLFSRLNGLFQPELNTKPTLMKKLCTMLFIVLAGANAFAQAPISLPPNGDNQRSSVSQWIGPVEVKIDYHSPNVHDPNGNDRTGHIWGELVHYGMIDQGFGSSKAAPWRAGANENTTITFSHPVKVEGKDIAAGTYGLFLEVAKDGPWNLILSKDAGAWGSYFYNAAHDALKVPVNSNDAPYTEFLTFGFDDRLANSAVAFLQWEKKKVPFKIEVPNVNDLYVSMIRAELTNWPGFDVDNYRRAAMFCAQNKINLDEALAWADAAMDPNNGGKEDFNSLSTKAQVLMAQGKGNEAGAIMDKAIKIPGTGVQQIHQYGRTLLNMGQKEKAMEVFQYNAKTHPEEKFTTYVGLARGYTAMGNKKEAVKNWQTAIKNLPENQAANKAQYEAELKKVQDMK
jgi:tetratricopeptide (TPR) repeat protein